MYISDNYWNFLDALNNFEFSIIAGKEAVYDEPERRYIPIGVRR